MAASIEKVAATGSEQTEQGGFGHGYILNYPGTVVAGCL
jgi:hypothetical protein